ncbi:hypothetical protein P167DRAFT_537696 [Morchella conica CCBAS932]|uniref:Uncharacterized protein n=1 Tax=Morchella conica CCBAS932 TaxID=1392247 RepID=A0A3N4KI37_9PEZI|nr:hypothetical protein P167DRAFT_537696 [Morchella conica CCBAS932]
MWWWLLVLLWSGLVCSALLCSALVCAIIKQAWPNRDSGRQDVEFELNKLPS